MAIAPKATTGAIPVLWKMTTIKHLLRQSLALLLCVLLCSIPSFGAETNQHELQLDSDRAFSGRLTPQSPRVGDVVRNSLDMEFVFVPSGSFEMGLTKLEAESLIRECKATVPRCTINLQSEMPKRRITIPESFWIGRHEVTQEQYESVMGMTSRLDRSCGKRCPVGRVSWQDAKQFINRLNEQDERFTYSLPSEAQWEYSARAGETKIRYDSPDRIAWFADNSGNAPLDGVRTFLVESGLDSVVFFGILKRNGNRLRPVGLKAPNSWGLYDTVGNAMEWVEDVFNGDGMSGVPANGEPNLSSGNPGRRILRGGSFASLLHDARVTKRVDSDSLARFDDHSFRLVARPKLSSSRSSQNPKPGEILKTPAGIEVSWIPAGTFSMGSTESEIDEALQQCTRYAINCKRDWFLDETPQRQVKINNGFWMGRFEITQGEYLAVMGENPSRFGDCGKNCPVESVTWDDAQNFITKLNGRNDGFVYSLPTEAEWEYAARAGTITAFAFGDSLGSDQANFNWREPYRGGSDGLPISGTLKVGRFAPNPWGLFDMHGNVFEWVDGHWIDNYSNLSSDGVGQAVEANSKRRGIRGGSWNSPGWDTRSASRSGPKATIRSAIIGFRIVARAK